MIKVILMILAALGLFIAGVLAFAATKPDSFRVSRQTSIKAPPDKVYAVMSDFKRWSEWSPWHKLDPQMKVTYGAVTAGKGATYEWEGNDKVGAGRMEILDVTPSASIKTKLDFYRPFKAQNTAEYSLKADGDSTTVNWAMYGENNLMSKVMHVFMSMDSMVGKDFEEGLSNLKTVAEK
jgi:uncharacterized protein YndB with AHSA1/START domain